MQDFEVEAHGASSDKLHLTDIVVAGSSLDEPEFKQFSENGELQIEFHFSDDMIAEGLVKSKIEFIEIHYPVALSGKYRAAISRSQDTLNRLLTKLVDERAQFVVFQYYELNSSESLDSRLRRNLNKKVVEETSELAQMLVRVAIALAAQSVGETKPPKQSRVLYDSRNRKAVRLYWESGLVLSLEMQRTHDIMVRAVLPGKETPQIGRLKPEMAKILGWRTPRPVVSKPVGRERKNSKAA